MFILGKDSYEVIYGPDQLEQIKSMVDIAGPAQTAESVRNNPSILKDVDVIFSGWGAPVMDEKFLKAAPNLKVVFYGAGSVRGFVTEALWKRNVIVTSSYGANAIPVAEYCLATILFSLKLGWRHMTLIRQEKRWIERVKSPGAYGSTVGLISLGMIGRKTLELLKPFDLQIIVYSTSLTDEKAREMNVEKCGLDEVFRNSDVVSLHTPNIPETRGMITGDHFKLMKQDATFINTARGAVVREPEMIKVLKQRPDITAVLDVTCPEPPEQGSPLYELPNVVLTPHIAGSLFRECNRMGQFAVDECRRFINGEPLKWQITREMAARLA